MGRERGKRGRERGRGKRERGEESREGERGRGGGTEEEERRGERWFVWPTLLSGGLCVGEERESVIGEGGEGGEGR